jgi:hypothetical protein
MKTLGDLRELLKANDGKIEIGGISIIGIENQDIDIKYGYQLVAWYSSTQDSENLLDDDGTFTKDFSFRKKIEGSDKEKILNEQLEEKEKIIEENKKEITGLETMVHSNALAVGKVEAYEKLLIGREITISK